MTIEQLARQTKTYGVGETVNRPGTVKHTEGYATPKQVAYAKSLLARRGEYRRPSQLRDMTRSEISQLISSLR